MVRHPNFQRGNIYLSGGMQFAPELGAKWRIECSKKLRELDYYPIDITHLDVEYSKQHGQLYNSLEGDYLQMKSNIRKHFVHTDVELIKNDSDALIVYYDDSVRRGAGTISECQMAYNLELPVLLVSAYPEWRKEIPSWLHALSTKVFVSFSDLFAYLTTLPYGILKKDLYGNHNSDDMYLCSLCGDPFKKHKHHFVSKISPLFCNGCVEIVKTTYESHKDRYEFFLEELDKDLT